MGLAGWQEHPGYLKSPEQKKTLEECARIADHMILIRRDRWPGQE